MNSLLVSIFVFKPLHKDFLLLILLLILVTCLFDYVLALWAEMEFWSLLLNCGFVPLLSSLARKSNSHKCISYGCRLSVYEAHSFESCMSNTSLCCYSFLHFFQVKTIFLREVYIRWLKRYEMHILISATICHRSHPIFTIITCCVWPDSDVSFILDVDAETDISKKRVKITPLFSWKA